MTNKYTKKKNDALGMNFCTATNRLKKQLLFSLVKKLEMDYCFQCGAQIEDIRQLSVEHKIPWLSSDNPKELFWDLENLAFSHLSCNSAASSR